MVKKIKFMRSLFILIVMFFGCISKKPMFEISILSLKDADKPYPVIILTSNNLANYKSEFSKHYYKIEHSDFEKIEKQCSNFRVSGNGESKLLLIEINKNNKIEKYFFNGKNGVDILNEIKKQTSHYKNESLTKNILYLQKVTEN